MRLTYIIIFSLLITGSVVFQPDAFGAGALDRRRGDVIMPKIEFDPSMAIPDDLSNPEGFQKYLDEIDADILPRIRKESPEYARHLSGVTPITPKMNPSELQQFTQDTAKMLFERGGYTEEDQAKIRDYIDMNKEKSSYEDMHLIVFLSSSMPAATIKNYVVQLGDINNVVFVIRGFVGNDPSKIMPTIKWLKGFKCNGDGEDAVCVKAPMDINPMLFRWLKIKNVPALAYVVKPTELESCNSDTEIDEKDFLVFYGDVSPAYILSQFQKERPTDPLLARLVSSIEGISWEREQNNQVLVYEGLPGNRSSNPPSAEPTSSNSTEDSIPVTTE